GQYAGAFFFSSRRRHTRSDRDWSSDVCSSDLVAVPLVDLRKRLSVPAPLREETRTVILEWEGGKLGVIVDAVTEVLQVTAPEIKIGRASCRERGELEGGEGGAKKKSERSERIE